MYSDNEEQSVEEVFSAVETQNSKSSEEAPMEEWASLVIVYEEPKPKRLLYEQGHYDLSSGDICSKYIALSDSSVMRHPYYKYPVLQDPGITEALLNPENPVIYPNDGQKQYMAECQDMDLCPVSIFHKGLLQNEINLKYYGVNPKGVRAMANALRYNEYVKLFNLTDNFLSVDASYHLGDMLRSNITLVELDLSGCRIGPGGAKVLFANMMTNRTLRALNLSKNQLGDASMEYFALALSNGLNIKMIDLSHNALSGDGMKYLIDAFQVYNNITHWNLSWNNLLTPTTYNFLSSLADTSNGIKKMDLSWNGLGSVKVAMGIETLLKVKNLKHLNLSNNRLEGDAIKKIMSSLSKAKSLVSLNLSNNPMTTTDANLILKKLQLRTVKVQRVYMDNVSVDVEFMKDLEELIKTKKTLVVTHGFIIGTFKAVGADMKNIVLRRAEFLCRSQKKNKVDFVLFMLALQKEVQKSGAAIATGEIKKRLRFEGATLDNDLVDALMTEFPGPRTDKGDKTLNFEKVCEHLRRLWPDRKLPPTPPPEQEELPMPPLQLAVKGKGKKKGKK